MPRTLSRAGGTLRGGAIDDQFSRRTISVGWVLRLADRGGDFLNPGNWTYTQIPTKAVLSRSRNAQLGEGPAHLTLVLLADACLIAPERYMRIEVDRKRGPFPPNLWPYFTGTITSVRKVYEERGGATVATYHVEAYDELVRCRGRWIDTIAIAPSQGTASVYQLIGITKEARGSFAAKGPSSNQDVPEAYNTLDFSTDGSNTMFSPNADYSSPYTRSTHYNLTTSTYPAQVNWTGSGPAIGTTVYYKYWQVQYFGIRRHQGGTLPFWFVCPYGRDYRDVFQTEVSVYAGGGPTIIPKDPTPYLSGAALLDPADGSPMFSLLGAQKEYLSIVDADDGTEEIEEIVSTDSSGVITLGAAPSTFTPAAGDAIRVITTECFSAWEEFGHRGFADSRATTNDDGGGIDASETTITVSNGTKFAENNVILIDSEQMLVTGISTNDLTVTRGYNGTTAATHANSLAIYKKKNNADRDQIRFFLDVTQVNEGAEFSSSDTVLTVDNGGAISDGSLLLIDGEILMVMMGGGTANLTVVRGTNGSTAAAHADDSKVYVEARRNLDPPVKSPV